MKSKVFALAIAMAAVGAWAQQPLPPNTVIQAELRTRLDSGHAKTGDQVKAQVTKEVKVGGQVVLPKGALLTGRVTGVLKAESNKSPSRIGVLFTQATYKKQPPIALRAGIARVVSTPNAPPMDMGPPDMGMPMPQGVPRDSSSDQGLPGEVTRGGSIGGNMQLPSQVTAAVPSGSAAGSRAANIEVTIPPAPADAARAPVGSVLSSPQGDVRLDSGARLELEVLH